MGEGIALERWLEAEAESAREALATLERDLAQVEDEWAQLEGMRSQLTQTAERFSPEEREEFLDRSLRAAARRSELRTWLKAAVERLALIDAVRGSVLAELIALREAAAQPEPEPASRPFTALEIHEAVEADRLRIARDLHDGPAQVLSNLVLEAEILERLLRRDPELVQAEIQDFRNSVTNAVADVRRFMFDLRPDSLDDLGLVATLRRFTSEWQQRTGVTCRLNLTGDERRLQPRLEEALYRIIQESLNNAWRHGSPRTVEIHLDFRPDRVRLRVRDDGRGFDPQAAPEEGPRRLGLLGMRERAAAVGGTLQVESRPGAGTEVAGDFPLVPPPPAAS